MHPFELFFLLAMVALMGIQVVRRFKYVSELLHYGKSGHLDGRWSPRPELEEGRARSQTYSQNGIDYVDDYVQRFLDAEASCVSLGIFNPDTEFGVGLTRQEGVVTFLFILRGSDSREQGRDITAFFAERGMEPISDNVEVRGFFAKAARLLRFPAPGSRYALIRICKDILFDLCRVTETDRLTFLFDVDGRR